MKFPRWEVQVGSLKWQVDLRPDQVVMVRPMIYRWSVICGMWKVWKANNKNRTLNKRVREILKSGRRGARMVETRLYSIPKRLRIKEQEKRQKSS